MDHPKRLIIATRSSKLAVMQAKSVQSALSSLYPNCITELITMKTKGDRVLDRAISKIGGKGIFVKELEHALLDKRADLAVHSMKDVPIKIESPLEICSILRRDDPRDAFISNDYASINDLPKGSIIGTSSLRRESQIRSKYPSLIVEPIRGNIETRLKKLDSGDYDGIILAAVGLKRLGLEKRICDFLNTSDFLPSPGQGALGIEINSDRAYLRSCLAPLACKLTTACSAAERAASWALSGSCQIPFAAYADVVSQGKLLLKVLISSIDGKHAIYSEKTGTVMNAEKLGLEVAQDLLNRGARLILEAFSG